MTGRVTPMMGQYNEIKARYPDAIVFFRLGDFYEMFGDDAVTASRVLEITLTSREVSKGERIPMCGVPYHAADGYLATLVQKGFKVAICEQLEDPAEAKGVVRRDVVRIVTPGTVTLPQALEAKAHRLLAALCRHQRQWGLAALDASTGEFWATQIEGADARIKVAEELARLRPAELLLGPGVSAEEVAGLGVGAVDDRHERSFHLDTAYRFLTGHFGTRSLQGFGLEGLPAAIRAAGAALAYLAETQKTALAHVTRLVSYHVDAHMRLDEATRRNLELTRRLRDGGVHGSLLWVLDRTETAMGGRLLRTWIEQPLLDLHAIQGRLDAVEALVARPGLRQRLRGELREMADLERLVGRVAAQAANARDLQALRRSLDRVGPLAETLRTGLADAPCPRTLLELLEQLDPVDEVRLELAAALADELPLSVKEGGLIRDGYDKEVDELRLAARDGRRWIAELEERERERTGIRSLKVGYNKVFGYYLEVTRANLDRVPEDFQRRQTLRHAERFITPELKEKEAMVLGASERLIEREYRLFLQLRELVRDHIPRIQETARALACLDALLSLAEAAAEHRYVRPKFNEQGKIYIREGRHPVVEAFQREQGFVPNDTYLSPEGTRLMILTGPNMAGKSTYLRQVALIVLMAQIGSFVPAAEADLCVVDRIFTRIGASDDLAGGQSTFMVEMNEAAYILLHATKDSLVLLDELGRGTSTYDGVALAQAIAEYLHDHIRAKTIMSTHYHELTGLEAHLEGARNYHAAVREEGGTITFLHRILPGAADRSYGVNVARMAGLPEPVLRRARRILRRLEGQAALAARDQHPGQLAFFDLPEADAAPVPVKGEEEAAAAAEEDRRAEGGVLEPGAARVLEELSGTPVEATTPLQALALIERWQALLRGEGPSPDGKGQGG